MWADALSKRPGVAGWIHYVATALLLFFATMTSAFAGQLTLAWDPVANATGYKVHYGTSSTSYAASVDAKTATSYTLTNLTDGARYYFAVTSYNGTTESSYSSQISATVPVAAAPAASFTASPTTGVAPLAVTLTDTSTGTISSRSWNLGDGTMSSSQTVAKSYTSPGTYTVTLTVTGSGGSTTASRTITVSAAPPVASFSATPVSGSSPLTVSFMDSSAGTIASWAWDFGDGGTSTAKNPSYTYSTSGTFSVSLTVTGPSGTNKTIKAGLVSVTAPVASSPSTSSGTGTTASVAPAANGLVAAYGFEESGGSKVIDASGNGNHGTLSGTVRRSTKRFGTAMEFNGSSSMITVNDSVSLDLTKGMTLQAWVYPTAKTLQTWHTVIAKEKSGGAPYGLYVTHDSTRAATIIEVAGTQKTLMPTGSLPIGKWTHLAATYDGVTQRMFVNGTQVDSRPQAGFIDVSDGKLRIGGNLTWAEYFKGRLDEVRIYNRALSQAEILADSQSPVVTLMLSTAADRSNPVPLAGDVVSGTIYVFYQPLGPALNANPVNQVEFWLDDPQPTNPTGAPRIVERQAPFDFAGTTSTGTAMPFNTSALAKGVHTISARVTLKDGTVLPTATGRFTIP